LLIQGLQDEYGTRRQVDAIVSAMTCPTETLMLDACGHTPHVDQRSAVETAMTEFVRSCMRQVDPPG
jgi:pimeloyl-ACP methyl ester carboxylesterase